MIAQALVSHALHVARYLEAAEGYALVEVPELRYAGCDWVMVSARPSKLELVCVVDATTDTSRRYRLDPDATRALMKRLQARHRPDAVLPPTLQIVEIRSRFDRARHAELEKLTSHFGAIVTAHSVSVADGDVRASTWLRTGLHRSIREALAGARRHHALDARAASDAMVASAPFPVVASTLALVMLAVYGLALLLAGRPAIDVATLRALGGLEADAVLVSGQWFRLFAAGLLHAGPGSLVIDLAALLLVGWLLERLAGKAWVTLGFVAGTLGGSLAELLVTSPTGAVTAGASSGVTALVVAAVALVWREPLPRRRSAMLHAFGALLLVQLIPPAVAAATGQQLAVRSLIGQAGAIVAGGFLGLAFLSLEVGRQNERSRDGRVSPSRPREPSVAVQMSK